MATPELDRIVEALRPDEVALRDWVRPRLDAGTLREMAALDYGMQIDEHLRGIEGLLNTRRLPAEIEWNPREVLELARYSGPAAARLFACMVLVRADGTVMPAETLAGLVDAVLELGDEAIEPAVRYLAWCRRDEPGVWRGAPEALPFLTLGLLLVYVMRPATAGQAVVDGLARAFLDEVTATVQAWEEPGKALRRTAGGPGVAGLAGAGRAVPRRCAPAFLRRRRDRRGRDKCQWCSWMLRSGGRARAGTECCAWG
ncbi:hypothetical protein [Dactylosporangium darangshiense]|uniref:Uncharacterized protein n=1 Tax=Dactylosporangium darangshiense TaxID=579108 RepID=A0ABP8DJT2_9ACTN